MKATYEQLEAEVAVLREALEHAKEELVSLSDEGPNHVREAAEICEETLANPNSRAEALLEVVKAAEYLSNEFDKHGLAKILNVGELFQAIKKYRETK